MKKNPFFEDDVYQRVLAKQTVPPQKTVAKNPFDSDDDEEKMDLNPIDPFPEPGFTPPEIMEQLKKQAEEERREMETYYASLEQQLSPKP